MSEWITVLDGHISGHFSGAAPAGAIAVPDGWDGQVGQAVAEFDADFKLKTLGERVKLGLVELAAGLIVGDDDQPRPMTDRELIEAKLLERPRGTVLDGERLRPATYDEQVKVGDLSQEVAFSLKLRDCLDLRRSEYSLVSDPIFFQYQRGEATREAWMEAVAAVKKKIPKPEE